MVKPVPDGYHTVTPYLIVSGGAKALEFYARAFGAVERERIEDGSGRIGHAEVVIGTSRVMLADEHPEVGALSPTTVGGSPTGPSPPARSSRAPLPTSSTATGSAASPTRSAIAGSSPPARRT